MTPEVVARAFDPFFTTKDLGKGSGLGLSQVYGFANQSGGHASIQSRPGEGTLVSIFLPTIASPTLTFSKQPAPPPAAIPNTVRILLVEDDAELCATLLETLSSDHWDVTAAPSSEAALAVLQQDETIGILVTDIALGAGMSGIDLAHAAVARCPDLSVILTSGYPGAQGTAGYRFEVLQKPFTGAQLVARIQITRAARERLSANGVADRGWRERGVYTKILGLHTYHFAEDWAAFLSADKSKSHEVALIQLGADAPLQEPRQVGLNHMAWMVDDLDQLKAAYKRLKDNSVTIDHISDHGLSLGIYFRDPDGNGVEVSYELPRDQWPRQEQVFASDVVNLGKFPGPWDDDPAYRRAQQAATR
jgi:catechol 2,3-dioxygenase